MPFGKDKPDNDFVAEMVIALDTINVVKADTKKDSTGTFRKRLQTERSCGKISTPLKDKVALIYLNPACDASTQVLSAQTAGASAVIVVHTTNSKDSVTLPKKSNTIRYEDDSKVKIPCFTVRKEIGDKLTRLMPSMVGIKRPKENIVGGQGLIVDSTRLVQQAQVAQEAKQSATVEVVTQSEQSEQNDFAAKYGFGGKGWQLSPNPSDNHAVLTYNFAKSLDLSVDVFNKLGQVIATYPLSGTQTGQLTLDVSQWQAGTYVVSLRSSTWNEVKQLVVVR